MDLMKNEFGHIKGTHIYECLKFGADPNKNPDHVNFMTRLLSLGGSMHSIKCLVSVEF